MKTPLAHFQGAADFPPYRTVGNRPCDPEKSRSSEEESIDRKVEHQLLLLNSDMEEKAEERRYL